MIHIFFVVTAEGVYSVLDIIYLLHFGKARLALQLRQASVFGLASAMRIKMIAHVSSSSITKGLLAQNAPASRVCIFKHGAN